MDIDAQTAGELGWPKLKYAFVERERRWLCNAVPLEGVTRAERITDLYVQEARLRLRKALPLGGGETMRRLARKADVRPGVRLITSIYLSAHKFELLASLPGRLLCKTRHHVIAGGGVPLSVDAFEGVLAGPVLAEAEFQDEAAMSTFEPPAFCGREVTADPRYDGGALCWTGLPGSPS